MKNKKIRILAIDQGTTSSRAIIFEFTEKKYQPKIVAISQKEIKQFYPKPGWVEQNPDEILRSVVFVCKDVIKKTRINPKQIAAIGITNQRETTVVWDKKTGKPVHRAIVWQDRRTAEICQKIKKVGGEKTKREVRRKTGLLIDPYFCATKIKWIVDEVGNANRDLMFGTIDTFVMNKIVEGNPHLTDATNASRTMLFDIQKNQWDNNLMEMFGVKSGGTSASKGTGKGKSAGKGAGKRKRMSRRSPNVIMPEVRNCADMFGFTKILGGGSVIPVLGVAGDQQAAAVGNGCMEPGSLKATYGTGCFALLNTGKNKVSSNNQLLTTIAVRLNNQTEYALEGSIFMAGATVQWLRDKLKIIKTASEVGELAKKADPQEKVVMVPAFTGLGAPWWDPDAKAAIFGMSRNTGVNEIAKATLEAVCFQTRDLIEAMERDYKKKNRIVRVDGGMSASDWTMQRLANMLNTPIERPEIMETTALGAAWLAGYEAQVLPSKKSFTEQWKPKKRFLPNNENKDRNKQYSDWKKYVKKILTQ